MTDEITITKYPLRKVCATCQHLHMEYNRSKGTEYCQMNVINIINKVPSLRTPLRNNTGCSRHTYNQGLLNQLKRFDER